MAVSSSQQLPKGDPDLSKINGFNGMTVTVNKYLNPRQPPTMVIPPTDMRSEQMIELFTQLPIQHGPAYYKFIVTETGGTGEDIFGMKLGPEQPEGSPMATAPPINGANGVSSNLGQTSEGVRHLGHGFAYDEALSAIVTPWRTLEPWMPGQPFPKPPTQIAAAAAAANPWGPNTMAVPGMGGWGSWPANDGPTERERQLQAKLDEDKRQRDMDRLRDDMRRGQDEVTKTIAALLAKIGEKPAGPSESELQLRREVEETKRQAAETARRAEETQREADRRREDEKREEQRRRDDDKRAEEHRREMQALAGSNKQDSMLTMLTTLMTTMQASASEQVKAIQTMMTGLASASERGTAEIARRMETLMMSPTMLMQIMNTAKGDASEMTKMLLTSARETMGLQKDVFEQLLEASQSPAQPAWLTAVEKVADRATAIGAAFAERQAQQPAPPPLQMVQQVQRAPMVHRQMAPATTTATLPTGTQVVLPAAPVATSRPGAVDTGGRPEGAKYDPANDTFLLRDGSRVRRSDAERIGWKAVFAEPQSYVFPKDTVVLPLPSTGEPSSPAPVVQHGVATAPVPQPQPQLQIVPPLPPEKKKRGKGKKNQPVDPTQLTVGKLAEMDPEDVFNLIQVFNDEVVFGPAIWPFVKQLRDALGKDPNLTPEKVADAIMQARQHVKDGTIAPPMAIDLVDALQLDVLVARLLPGAQPAALDAVVEALEVKLRAAGVEIPEEDDEESEGGEAQE